MAAFKVRFAPLTAWQVEGWIEGVNADTAISLFIDDRLEANGIADQPRNEPTQRGFSLTLPPHVRDGRVHKISLRIKDHATELGPYPLIGVIALDAAPESQRAVSAFAAQKLAAAKPIPEAPSEAIDAPYRAKIDGIKRGRKRLLVHGWAARPDGSALGTVLRLSLGKQIVTIPPEGFHADRVSFAALFDIGARARLPENIQLDTGQGTPVLPLSLAEAGEAVNGDIELQGGDTLAGWFADLDGGPSGIYFRIANFGFSTFYLHAHPARVFDAAGAAKIHFTRTLDQIAEALGYGGAAFTLEDGRLPVEFLDASGDVLHTVTVSVASSVRLNVEQAAPERLSGWMVNSHHPERTAALDLYVDGIYFDTIWATHHRQDVINAGLVTRGGGFEVVPATLDAGEHLLQFAPRFSRNFIGDGHKIIVGARPEPLKNIHARLTEARPVTVVTVADKGNRQYLELLRAETPGARLIAFGEGDIAGIEFHDAPPSFALAAELAGGDDLVWLGPLVKVKSGWLDGLRLAALSDPRIATVTPVSDMGWFAVPVGVAGWGEVAAGGVDQARRVRQASSGRYPRISVPDGQCLYVRRAALDQLGKPDGTGDFVRAANRAGLVHIIDDRTLVHHVGAHFDGTSPDLWPLSKADTDALAAVRWRIRRSLAESPAPPKPRLLYVISTRGGGTPETNRDLMQAVSGEYEPWVLVSDARTLELYRWRDGREDLVETITMEAAIQPTLHRSAEYDDAVAYLLLKHAFEAVHIRHLGWHGAGLPEVAKKLGLPVIFSIHDFYTVCPNTKLLDDLNRYCGGCTQKADEPPRETDCASELWPQDQFPRIRDGFVHRWREIFAEAFTHCDAFVTTSDSVREVFLRVYSQLAEADFRVIPHGRTFADIRRSATRPDPRKRLKILVPGNISPPKGADLINALVAHDREPLLEFHMLGDAEWITPAETVIRHGRYKREDFAARVAAIAPHIGMVPSICPETFCHTLTEMWASGLPVAGLDLGAVGERLRRHGAGWLLPADGDIAGCYEVLTGISEDGWQAKIDAVTRWQAGENIAHSTAWMGEQYAALYRQLLKT